VTKKEKIIIMDTNKKDLPCKYIMMSRTKKVNVKREVVSANPLQTLNSDFTIDKDGNIYFIHGLKRSSIRMIQTSKVEFTNIDGELTAEILSINCKKFFSSHKKCQFVGITAGRTQGIYAADTSVNSIYKFGDDGGFSRIGLASKFRIMKSLNNDNYDNMYVLISNEVRKICAKEQIIFAHERLAYDFKYYYVQQKHLSNEISISLLINKLHTAVISTRCPHLTLIL